MEKLNEIAKAIGVLPKLQLSDETARGGRAGNGPHTVKFVEEPIVVMGKERSGKPRKELKFKIQEGEQEYFWRVPILNKEGQPNYLFERLLDVQVGDERVLEMKKTGLISYISVSKVGEEHIEENEDGEDVIEYPEDDLDPHTVNAL